MEKEDENIDSEEISIRKNNRVGSLTDDNIEIVEMSRMESEQTFDEMKAPSRANQDPIAIIDTEATKNVTLFKPIADTSCEASVIVTQSDFSFKNETRKKSVSVEFNEADQGATYFTDKEFESDGSEKSHDSSVASYRERKL